MPETYPPVEELIPHRGPMCLLRRVLAIGEREIVAEAVLAPESPLLGAGSQAWSVEIVAQAAAAFVGWTCRERGWRSGRLIKVARWKMEPLPLPSGGLLRVYSVLDTMSETGLFRFDGYLEDSSARRLAAGQLTILAS
jgi:predicted hotdog family 3-hydroxylacyl-ACP dehydratase